MLRSLLIACLCAPASTAVHADEGKYKVTAVERAACTPDAVRLCSDAYPDEDRLLTCMKAKRDQLSSTCQPVFDAGVKRRRL